MSLSCVFLNVCAKVSNVRNNVMHSPNLKVTQDDLREYLRRIKSLANTLEEHSKEHSDLFKGLIQELDKVCMCVSLSCFYFLIFGGELLCGASFVFFLY